MRSQKLVFDGANILVERERLIVVRRGFVLAKVYYFYLGLIDNLLINGNVVSMPPRILGSSGLVRVLEVSPSIEESIAGKLVMIKPFGRLGVLVLDTDGVAANFTSIHASYLHYYVENIDPWYSVYPLILHGFRLAEVSEEPVLITGCNIVSMSAALYLEMKNVSYSMYCEKTNYARRLGLNAYRNAKDLGKKYNSIIITPAPPGHVISLLEESSFNSIVLSGIINIDYLPISIIRKNKDLRLRIIEELSANTVFARRASQKLKRFIDIVHVSDLEEIINLLPVRKLGLIIGFKTRS